MHWIAHEHVNFDITETAKASEPINLRYFVSFRASLSVSFRRNPMKSLYDLEPMKIYLIYVTYK